MYESNGTKKYWKIPELLKMCEDSADEVTGCDDTCDLDTWYDNNDVDNTVEGTSEVFNTVLEEFGFVTTWSCLIYKQDFFNDKGSEKICAKILLSVIISISRNFLISTCKIKLFHSLKRRMLKSMIYEKILF